MSIRAAYNSGIIDYSINGTKKYQEEANKEESVISETENFMKSILARLSESQENINEGPNGDGDGEGEEPPFPKVSVGEKATENSTINGEESSPSNPIIPTNYYPIDTDTSSWGDGDDEPTPEDVSAGLVITDEVDGNGQSIGNEWVWVPVQKNAQGKAISNNGTSDVVIYEEDANGVSMYTNASYGTTKTYKYSASGILSGKNRGLPSSTSYREPAMVVGSGTDYDNGVYIVDGTTKLYAIAGYSSLTEMAEGFRDDYADMIESIEEYGGFYIGRYELSTEGTKRNQPVEKGIINGTSFHWYQLYADCKHLGASSNVQTRMIWSCLWDVTCNWIASEKDTNNQSIYDITNSSKWGNYINYNSSNGYSNGDTGYVAGAGSLQNTGFSEYWKAKNIYDLAGNSNETTQEAYGNEYRVEGGGTCNEYGGGYPVSDQVSTRACPGISCNATTRPVLYVK